MFLLKIDDGARKIGYAMWLGLVAIAVLRPFYRKHAKDCQEINAMSLKVKAPLSLRPALYLSFALAACSGALSTNAVANQQLMSKVDATSGRNLGHYANFNQWLADFRRYAAQQGISESTLVSAFDGLRYRERVIELDRYQPEFVRPIWQYLDTAVSSTRINNGLEKLAAHRDTAQQMQQRYGVPAEIIVAIWGIESNYGSNFHSLDT